MSKKEDYQTSTVDGAAGFERSRSILCDCIPDYDDEEIYGDYGELPSEDELLQELVDNFDDSDYENDHREPEDCQSHYDDDGIFDLFFIGY